MPALYPASNDTENSLWRKILTNPGGTDTYMLGDPDHAIMKKILRNMGGPQYPASTDTETVTVRKILRNQAENLISECGATDVQYPNSSDTVTRLLAKILINQSATLGYVNGMSDNPILKRILRNQADAVEAANGNQSVLANILKVIGPCGGG